ncbi:GNAT family N-acetyltransferase [Actinophytocola gossypii]|uniref:GNAT family N-acetyltransferase n=1 Tax=Actinophytocola gossypii TaxID=2812003 RepID=A0ABT2JGL6_9PSEU|nr:GNAT family N-acetyltransferase [Actinophytocola gossypii]MCT2586856.1 GNAT family N-acetyltransferase [Actinophytocola gossypii]
MRVGAPVLVREATVADADAVGEVHAEAWRAGHRDVFEGDWLRRLAEQRRTLWSSVMTSREFARNTMLVAERGHRVAAFAYCGPHSDRGPGGEVFDLYAHPTVWGHGVAWTLLDAACESLRDTGFRRVRLWTMAGANRARHFYTSYGFTETPRRREHDFGDGRPVLEVEYERRLR